MREVILTCGSKTQVSDEDYSFLKLWQWRKHPKGYVVRGERRGGRKATYVNIRMHVVVAERAGLKGLIDHKDQDKLNNQRDNLRVATKSQNGGNSSNADGSWKGVSWSKEKMMWQAYIKVDYQQHHLGYYACPKQAAIAYNLAAVKYFGEYASLNEVN